MDVDFVRNYASNGVPDTYNARAQRRAVLVPLFGNFQNGDVPRLVLSGRASLVSRWRSVVTRTIEDWEDGDSAWPARISSRFSAMFNCRPTFIAPVIAGGDRSCACSTPVWCPFCYGRWVGRVFDAVSWSMFDDPSIRPVCATRRSRDSAGCRITLDMPVLALRERSPACSPFDLIERTTCLQPDTTPFTLGKWAGEDESPKTRMLFRLIRARTGGMPEVQYGRPYEFKRCKEFGVLGAYEYMSIGVRERDNAAERKVGRYSHWNITFRQLLMVPRKWDLDRPGIREWLDDPRLGFGKPGARKAKWRRTACPTRQDVAMAVGRWGAYSPLLLYGSPWIIREVLDSRERRKLSQAFGAFRNGAQRAEAPSDG